MLVRAVPIVVARTFIEAVAVNPTNAATSAYSMRSWPDSSRKRFDKSRLRRFITPVPTYTAAVNLLPTVLKAVLILVARLFIAAVAPRAINAATSAYSIRSWPDSSLIKLDRMRLRFFNAVLLLGLPDNENTGYLMEWCI
jgi:hypothetical protein